MTDPSPLLEMKSVKKRFGPTIALGGVDFCLRPGEVHALVGENGAGKSTLMKVLSGAHPPDEGLMLISGQPYLPQHPMDARRKGIAMIYQELALALHLSVEANIMLGIEPSRFGFLRRRQMRDTVMQALKELEHPEIRPETRVAQLSAGARQLVEIARALVIRCKVLVLDEPTSSLGHDDAERLYALIGRLKARGIGIVYISHFLEEVQRIADRFTVLREGHTVGGGTVAGTSANEIVRLMVGRKIQEIFPRSERTPGEIVLEVEHLQGARRPVDASFILRRGEVLGIAGLVGAGRTELLRTLFGLDPIKSGKVRVGACSGWARPRQRLKQGLGLLSEDRKEEGLAPQLTIADNMTLSRMGGFGPWGLLFPDRQKAAVAQWIETLDIRCADAHQRISELSGGNQQKVALGRLLHHDADVLLLDEPTRGIDIGSKALIYKRIDQLAAEGKAVLLISSYVPELLGVCDRIAVMCKGVLGAARPASACDAHSIVLEATGKGTEA